MKSINLELIVKDYSDKNSNIKKRLTLCAGTGCIANGALAVEDALVKALESHNITVTKFVEEKESSESSIHISESGCQGFCQMGPLLRIEPLGLLYVLVKPEDADEIIEQSILKDEIIERLLFKDPKNGTSCKGDDDIQFYARQKRIIMRDSTIDPRSINEYIAKGGYEAAQKAYDNMTSEEVCNEILESGLRGRGGGGFPTGTKWKFALASKNDKKYVICNGDEGDPGAFMDRSVMEGNPHAVIEGMMIAAKAIGADEGYVYVRTEYQLAVKRMQLAVEAAEKLGIIGDKVFNKYNGFKLHVFEGAGAFVCGEETALIASIEGKRGMPTSKPPFPAVEGLHRKPTLINNVETLSCIPWIIKNGYEAFRKNGTDKSPGTKTFALTGNIANTGLIEVPFGTTLREIIFEIGGGVTDNEGKINNDNFKACQIGGPSGGCLTKDMLDLPLDFDSLAGVGAMVGSGGLVVMNSETCMVNIAKFFLTFAVEESCGKCTPCRIGGRQMLDILERITDGHGTQDDLDTLQELAVTIKSTSLCGLGMTTPNPVLSTMRYFPEEYKSHVFDKKCAAKKCPNLISYVIDPDKCIGCTLCKKKCPVSCIEGSVKKPHTIDNEKCIKCGACASACKFKAITKE